MPQPLMPKKLKLNSSMLTYKTFRTNTKKYVLFLIGDWNPKVGNQELPGVTDQFFLGVQNEAGQSLTEFCQEKTLVTANSLVIANTPSSNNTREDSIHGHHQVVNTKIRLIIYFAGKN